MAVGLRLRFPIIVSAALVSACGDDGAVTTTFNPDTAGPTTDETATTTDSTSPTTSVSASISDTASTSTTAPGTSTGEEESTTTGGPDTTTTGEESSSSETSTTGPIEDCGNEVVDAGEDCDGADLNAQDCARLGHVAGELACTKDCTFDDSACVDQLCGNDAIEGSEQCDGIDLDGEDCITQGADAGELACDAIDCIFDTSGCIMFSCGNDMQEGSEACDGDDLDGATCVTQGHDGGTLACAGNCMGFDTSGCFDCGDNVQEGTEVCDGTDINGQTCIGQGFDGGTLGCLANCSGYDTSGCHECGNGVAEGPELCDGADLGGESCFTRGFIGGGTLACTADCAGFLENCVDTICNTPGLPIGPAAGTLTLDTIGMPAVGGVIADVNVSVLANHTWIGDLEVDLRHVETDVSVSLLENPCGNFDNINATFDQDAAGLPVCGSPLGGGGSVRPVGDLENFTGLGGAAGTWELTLLDEVNADGGTLTQWCITVDTADTDPSACGDGHKQWSEICDGADLGGFDCASQGFGGGTLACTAGCTLDTSLCVPGETLQNDNGFCGPNEVGCSDAGGTAGNPQDNVECFTSSLTPPLAVSEVEYFLGVSVPLPTALTLVVFAWPGAGSPPGAQIGSAVLPAADIVTGQHTFVLPTPIASPSASFCVGLRGTAAGDGFRVSVSDAAVAGESYLTASACGLATATELSTAGVSDGAYCIRPTVLEQ